MKRCELTFSSSFRAPCPCPCPCPRSYDWCVIDVHDAAELSELYTLLTENYVEDDSAMFRFDYR